MMEWGDHMMHRLTAKCIADDTQELKVMVRLMQKPLGH